MAGYEPVANATPPESWAVTRLLIRGLELAADPEFRTCQRVTLNSAADSDDQELSVELDPPALGPLAEHLSRWRARPVWLRLRLEGRRHRWRSTWLVQAYVAGAAADEAVVLDVDQPSARVELRLGAILHLRPLVRHRFAQAPPLPLCEPVPILDRAFGRTTRQSSARGEISRATPLSVWMVATEAEREPWWEIDIGEACFVESIAIHAPRPVRAPARVSLYTYIDRNEQPAAPWTASLGLDGTVQRIEVGALGRFVRIELDAGEDRTTSLKLADLEIWAASLSVPDLLDNLRRTFTLFAERPLFAERRELPRGGLGPYEPWSSYAEVWDQALALASGLASVLEPSPGERVFVAICARGRPQWPITDIACVLRAYVVVPLAPSDGPAQWAEILARCSVHALVCEPGLVADFIALGERCPSLEHVIEMSPMPGEAATTEPSEGRVHHHRLTELSARGRARGPLAPAAREPEALYTLLFTSGSTGRPKGAMRSYAAFNAMVTAYGTLQPAIHLAYQPFSHLSERMMVPLVIQSGGQVGFASGDPARLFEDVAALEPSVFSGVPRVFDVLRSHYHRAVEAGRAARPEAPPGLVEAEVRASLRALFGPRLQSVSVGSAKPSAALLEFLAELFADVWMIEGYGITEVGTITVDGVIQPEVEVRLVDVPELAYLGTDDPPRGEIHVRTAHMISGYWGGEGRGPAFDDEGYFRTGDIGQRNPDGTVVVIGRRKDVVKLSQGEFVAPERIEGALLGSALVDQIYVHASPERDCVVAIVVPNTGLLDAKPDSDTARDQILAAVRETGTAAGLRRFEIPAAIAIEATPMSVARGLMTSTNKPKRRAMAAHYAAQIAALYQAAAPSPTRATLALVEDVAGELIGELDARAALSTGLGVDSLAGVELVATLQARLGREIPLAAWFGAASLEDFAQRLDASDPTQPAASSAELEWRGDLDFEIALEPVEHLAPARPARAWTELLLTGATGFLGRTLLEAVLARTETRVTCLVRAADEAAARERLVAALDEAGATLDIEAACASGRVRVCVGDLAGPKLGLEPAAWAELAARVDAIVHAGAVVNWIMRYGQLRAANVVGTRTLLALASDTRLKPFHHVSTISTAPASGNEHTSLSEAAAVASSGYALSKWIAERDVRRAGALGLPVAIHRPGMVAAHSTRGIANPSDFLTRYVRGCVGLGRYLALDEGLDMTPVDFVADAIVELARADIPTPEAPTYHLVNIEGSPSYRELGQTMVRAGAELQASDYAGFRAALAELAANGGLDQNPLLPLLPYFPAAGFGLAMGPWPSEHSRTALATLGLRCPTIDEAYVARMLDALAGPGSMA